MKTFLIEMLLVVFEAILLYLYKKFFNRAEVQTV